MPETAVPTKTLKPRKLAAKWVENLVPDATARLVCADLNLPGFALRVTPKPKGTKSFSYRYRYLGEQRRATWTYPAYGLGKAHDKAKAIARAVAEGVNPATLDGDAAKDGRTLEHVAGLYFEEELKAKGLRTGKAIEAAIRKELLNGPEKLGNRPIATITDRDLNDVLDRLRKRAKAKAKSKEERRAKLDGRDPDPAEWQQAGGYDKNFVSFVRPLFAWAKRKKYLTADPALELEADARAEKPRRPLTDRELEAVWRLAPQVHSTYGDIVRLLALTGCRLAEISDVTWTEYNSETGELLIAAERVKNKLPFLVPLPKAASDIIGTRGDGDERVYRFTTTGKTPVSGFSKWQSELNALIRKERAESKSARLVGFFDKPWSLHCLRHTVSTGMSELGVEPHVVEAAINHKSGYKSGVAGRYNHFQYRDQKAMALRRWADRLADIVAGRTSNAVTLAATG